ncbi:MAG TPA: NAD(+) synthase [Gemmatimonadales bacterium]|nr:NAD(+) synthase [Gemmatimonadales bacterium]
MTADRLGLDAAAETRKIAAVLRDQGGRTLRRSGFVVAMSGGVDSSVCTGLAVAAVGPQHVLGLGLPERESDPRSVALARDWAERLGIEFIVEDITPILAACGCYERRDAAVRRLVPEYAPGWRCKLVLDGGGLDSDRLNVCFLAIEEPGQDVRKVRLPARELREIVAATNFKQRVRTMLAYHHADRLNYAVVGTPNRLEYDQGFFVKGGDGLADVKPIAHLYKSQVYRLAETLGVPAAIRERTPTTDTYSLPQTQEEFFFALPLATLDRVLQAWNEGRGAAEVGRELGFRPEQIARTYRDIDHKRRVTRPLHLTSLLVESVAGVGAGEGGRAAALDRREDA